MIIPNLTDFLDEREKKSVANVIFSGDKIIASGICQYLKEKNGEWILDKSPGVVIFAKNSSRKIHKIAFVEPIVNDHPVTHLEIIIRAKNYTIQQTHKNLVIFHDDNQKVIGFNFYDTEEATKFFTSLDSLKNKKRSNEKEKKKFSFRGIFSSKKEKELEIGKPTDFKHLQHVGLDMTADQQELYNLIMPGLKTQGKEDEEILKRFVVKNEDKLRQSMMKEKKRTPKSVKKGFFKSSKNKEESRIQEEEEKEEEASFKAPVDPLNPNWDEDGLAVPSIPQPSISQPAHVSNVVIPDHEPISYNNNNKYEQEEKFLTLRKDTYGIRNQPHTLYRFENEKEEIKPPTLPSRSTSRSDTLPRLPSHRRSYRWATNPAEASSPSPPSSSPSTPSTPTQQLVVRVAPPPPPPTPTPSAEPKVRPTPTPTPSVSLPPVKPPPVAPPPPPPAPPPPPPLSQSTPHIKVAPPPAPPLPSTGFESEDQNRKTSTISNERRSFLEEIQNADKSKILRKVSEDDNRISVTSPTNGENTMIDAIQQFLDARRTGINPSDSEDSDDSDDDWSD